MALIVKSTRERVVKLFIATVLCFGLASWCWYDATYKYVGQEDAKNRKINTAAIPVFTVLGLAALVFAVKAARLRIESDEQAGISVNGRDPIAWDTIEEVDTSVLSKRGYLYVKYRDRENSSATLKLDEFNLDYFAELYAMIRAKLGLPESDGPQTDSSSGSETSSASDDSAAKP